MGLFVALVVGCSETPYAPIEDRSGANPMAASSSGSAAVVRPKSLGGKALSAGEPYIVQKGDTLFSIAFALNMSLEQLAAINSLTQPDAIYPGQELKTVGVDARQISATTSMTLPATVTVQRGDTLYGIARQLGVSVQSIIDSNKLVPPYDLAIGQVLKTTPNTVKLATQSHLRDDRQSKQRSTKPSLSDQSTPSKPPPKPASSAKTPPTALGPVSRWRWPSTGRLVRQYSTNLHKGIDIAGQRGDPVKAAARGVVVYAGTGVKGYGALIIVKHNNDYLSAYGHNDAILVAEGATVADGEVIAHMGSSGTDSVKLHFEIRRQGKPVDPTKVLPRR